MTAQKSRKPQNKARNKRSGRLWAIFTPQLMLINPPIASGTPIIQFTW